MSTILMVDDAGLFQLLEASFLKRTGCRIVRAVDRPDCLAKARSLAPDLILLVTDHPSLDGVECIRELKADPSLRAIRILAVSDPEGAERCAAEGADDVLTRPVSRGRLIKTLESYGCVPRRSGARRSARLPTQIESSEGDRRGRLKDISRSGLFVAMPKPFAVNEPVNLSLHVPGPRGRANLRARGVVVRQVTDDPESHLLSGVGVRFTEMDSTTESLLDYFVGQAVLGEDPLESDDGGKDQA